MLDIARRVWRSPMRRCLLIGTIVLAAAGFEACTVWAQSPLIKNPSAVAFLCPDHGADDQHEIDIVRVSDGVVMQTLLGGDPPLSPAGEVVIVVNVMPVSFGSYRFVVRAVAGAVKSDSSVPSDIWERAPGRPTSVRPQ